MREWTVLIYLDGDNDLEQFAPQDEYGGVYFFTRAQ